MTRIDYVLSGVANGHQVCIAGRGTTAPGRLDMVFTAAEPAQAFDTPWAAIVGLDVLAALTRGLVVAPYLPTFARGRVDLLTERGAEIGTIVAHVAFHRRRGGYRCQAQIIEVWNVVEPGELLTRVGGASCTRCRCVAASRSTRRAPWRRRAGAIGRYSGRRS